MLRLQTILVRMTYEEILNKNFHLTRDNKGACRRVGLDEDWVSI